MGCRGQTFGDEASSVRPSRPRSEPPVAIQFVEPFDQSMGFAQVSPRLLEERTEPTRSPEERSHVGFPNSIVHEVVLESEMDPAFGRVAARIRGEGRVPSVVVHRRVLRLRPIGDKMAEHSGDDDDVPLDLLTLDALTQRASRCASPEAKLSTQQLR